MKKRNVNIEALRVILMLLIILLHLSGQFYNIQEIRTETSSFEDSAILSLRMIFMLGVNTFAFISGYYGIINIRGGKIKCISYELLALSWGVLFVLCELLCGHVNCRHMMDLLLPTTSGICWYFSAYIIMSILSPIINKGLGLLPKKEYALVLLFIFFIEFLGGTLYRVNGTTFMQLFYIYVIGRYLKMYPCKLIEEKSCSLFALSSGINFVFVFGCSYFQFAGDSLLRIMENNRNPLLLMSSVCLFILFKNGKQMRLFRLIAKLAPYMFSVYISHVSLLYLKVVNFQEIILVNPFISLIFYSFVLLFVCIVLDKIRILIFGGILNRIENKLTSMIL